MNRKLADVRMNANGNPAMWLATAAIVVELTVSANTLTFLGVSYVSDGGSLLSKVHPATYLIVASACFSLRDKRSLASLIACVEPIILSYLITVVFCALYAGVMGQCGFVIVLIDTFFPAGLLAVVLRCATISERLTLLKALELCFALNATICLAEAASQTQFIPLYLNGAVYEPTSGDFRPTALYDHPLTGSMLTALGMMLPDRSTQRRGARISYLTLLFLAELAFGGRTAVVLLAIFFSVTVAKSSSHALLHRNMRSGATLSIIAVSMVVAPLLGMAAWASGMADRLLGHLYWDPSAQVRVRQWDVLAMLQPSQLIFGTRRDDLLALLTPLHLASGVEVIENFWLIMFIGLGSLAFPIFVVGLLCLLRWCARQAGQHGPLIVTCTILIASTSNSLGRKSGVLVVLVGAAVAAGYERVGALNSRNAVAHQITPHNQGVFTT